MFIKITRNKNPKLNKIYLVEGYRVDGKVKHRTVHCYGFLDNLLKEDSDIIEKLKEKAKNMPKGEITINHSLFAKNDDMIPDKNYGYFFLDHIYSSLGIKEFIWNYNFEVNFKYDLNEILRLFTFGRILYPASKKATIENQDEYFENFKVTLKAGYKSLASLAEINSALQKHLEQSVAAMYGRDDSLVFYDVTNYYFETEIESELKKKGMSKENKRTPIIQMGLLIDNKGLPIAYDLFSGNTHDSSTLIPFVEKMKEEHCFKKFILTADKGLNSGKNLAHLIEGGDGYIVSQKIRGGSKKFIDEVLSEEGYVYNNSGTFKVKSFLRDRDVKNEDDEIVTLREKVVCFWSKDFDEREKHKREKLEERISDFLESPSKLKASNSYGIKKYLKLKNIDTETGEVTNIKPYVEFDETKYLRDVSLDGYYAIVTSEVELKNEDVLKKYRGLWKIEESFRVLKSDLEGRPVYVRNEEHIKGHFLTCYLSLLVSRILEMQLDYRYSIKRIQRSLKNATCREIGNGVLSLNKQDDVFRAIESIYGIDMNFKNVRIEEMRRWSKYFNTTKK